MSKITGKSYRRKKIITGVVLFGSVALVSTGFAAWVLAAPTNSTKETSVEVGTITDKNMAFSNVDLFRTSDGGSTTVYKFEPLQSDLSGRVRYSGSAECLSLTFSATINHSENLGDITAQLLYKTGGTADSGDANGIASAVRKNYIVAPEAYTVDADHQTKIYDRNDPTANKVVIVSNTTDDSGVGTFKFTYEVKFSWGSFFNSKNPGLYYDEDEAGLAVPTGNSESPIDQTTVAGVLKDLRKNLNDIKFDLIVRANPTY